MAFADVADVETRLDRDLDPSEEARTLVLLEEATDLLLALTGQEILEGESTITLSGWRRVLVLPQIPVTEVEVSVDGVVYDPTRYEWTAGGLLTLRGGTWPRTVTVTYTHGYATVPGALARLCARMAMDTMTQPVSRKTSERIGDYAVGWKIDASILSPDDMLILDQYMQVLAP
jgi:hypothetical protein